MKSNNSLFLRWGLLAAVVLVGIAGGLLWWKDGITAVDPTDPKPVIFAISRGEGVRVIAGKLAQQNLIRSSTGFYILVKLLGIEKQIQAGDYRLNRSMDAEKIARELTHGILDAWVTTLEGWRVEEVAAKISKELDIPEQEFLKVAKEGYMFPDTYLVPQDATAGAVVAMMEKTFNTKVTETMRRDATKTGLTFDQVVILASIVEREGRTNTDRPMIAGILLKRLKEGWPLQVDATLQYALGYQPFEKSWWKKSLSDEDRNIKSPYNTYLHTELPPGPIANPGLASLQAVIYPITSENWYYLHDPSGVAHYAKTIEEHNANISVYLQ